MPFMRYGPTILDCLEGAMRSDPELTIEEAVRTVPIRTVPIRDPDACWQCGTPYDSTEDGCDACDA